MTPYLSLAIWVPIAAVVAAVLLIVGIAYAATRGTGSRTTPTAVVRTSR